MWVENRCNYLHSNFLGSIAIITALTVYGVLYFQISDHVTVNFQSINWNLFYKHWHSRFLNTANTTLNLSPIEQRFKQRLKTLQQFCAGRPRQDMPYPEDNPFNYIELYDYYEANIFVCSPPKAASTTLDNYVIDNFIKPVCESSNITMERSATRNRHRMKETTTFESINKLDRMKILITREPLSRILSCWYDKFSGLMGGSHVQVILNNFELNVLF